MAAPVRNILDIPSYNISIAARSRNHCCSGKAKSITYSERVFLAFGIRNAMRMFHIVMWPARLYRVFPRYHITGAIFEWKLSNIKCVS
jgi:hypothetical protein